MMAPTESIVRSTPNARPNWAGGTEPASSESRAGALPPRATHETARATATTGHAPARPNAPWPRAVTA